MPEGFEVARAALYWGADPNEVINWPLYWIELAHVITETEKAIRERQESIAAKKDKRARGKRSR